MTEQTWPAIQLSPPLNITLIDRMADLPQLADFLERNPEFGWDVETLPTKDFYDRYMRTMQFGTRDEQVVVDLLGLVDGDSAALRTQGNYGKKLHPGLQALVDTIRTAVCERGHLKIGVSLSFEYMCCYWLMGLRTQNFFDCALVERCIWAGAHSLKDYAYFSMADMIGRYFHRQVSKELQTSFNLTDPLTDAQIEYAALDTRLPLLLKQAQEYVIRGDRPAAMPKYIHVPALVCGDDLQEIAQIENDAIGAFQDMAVHGDCLDIPRWTRKIEKRQIDMIESLAELDAEFVPYVGAKEVTVTKEQVDEAALLWKAIKLDKNTTPAQREERAKLKSAHSEMSKSFTARKKLVSGCQGTALINYNSPKQLKDVLRQVPGLERMKSTAAGTLERFEHIKIISALLNYRKISKEISTYGMTWCTEWVNELPSQTNKEVGWINPHDHRLHPRYNQYDAETGRTSSDGPNGQNVPHDPETRACFIAGPPDEDCPEGDEYQILTIDMAGAELRILAEMANDQLWITTFNNGGDVHCVESELVYPEEWAAARMPDCRYYEDKLANGKPRHPKCKCPKHNEIRNDLKPTNFGIPYGLGPRGLAAQLKKSEDTAKDILNRHKAANPGIWNYVDWLGKQAVQKLRSFDLFGRRRLFNEPTYEQAIKYAAEHRDDFDEPLTIKAALKAMYGAVERQGKNHPFQSGNCSIIKLAMGSGMDAQGLPYLWSKLSKYKARYIGMVHDELKIRVLKSNGEQVAKVIQDAILRAGATKMRRVKMESEHVIAAHWSKP